MNTSFDPYEIISEDNLISAEKNTRPTYIRAAIEADLQYIIRSISNTMISYADAGELFSLMGVRNQRIHRNSRLISKAIVSDLINELKKDEHGEALKEYHVEMFNISWVTQEMKRQRRLRQRLGMSR